ncbi:hypothetical protein [Rathayibacter soli]|uniref:hypothetical protein n=1 Tax=Rathayibacter soli TaxID=3144168 RepID=UPI0027E58F1A|nr:hypothetical protein [Glaciibacter superstes]
MSSKDEARRQPDAAGPPEPRIDPRFDPAFQRGYRPGHAAPRHDAVPENVGNDAVGNGAKGPGNAASEEVAPFDDEAQNFEPRAFEPANFEPPAFEPPAFEPRAPRTNPYLRALWIIGIGFVVAGIGLQLWAQTEAVNVSYDPRGGVPLNAVLLNLAYSVGGPLITTGLATVVGLLFLLAVRHHQGQRRP